MINEVSTLEKAMTKKDWAAQKSSLESIVKALRPLHLKSLEALDLNARGRLLTTLLRVQRQPKPAPGEAPAAPAETPPEAAPAEAAEAAPAEAAPEAAPAEGAAPVEGEAAPEGAPPAEAAPTTEPAATAAEAAAKAPPEDPMQKAWADVMFTVGQVWRAVGESDRAASAFELSGRSAPSRDEAPVSEEPREPRPPREGKGPREVKGPREGKGPREAKGPREERPRREKGEKPPKEEKGDWKIRARDVEEMGRTREAAKIHEQHKSYEEAARLYKVGGDKKGELRSTVLAKDYVTARALMKEFKPEEFRPILEQAQGWELLMEGYVASQDFDNVAKLYERARQFDQAALAWERAGKFANARKAFERANDKEGAERMRTAEVQKLIERGDRLGAATLLVQAGQKDKAVESLSSLPPPKAYRFLQRLKLDDEAMALAKSELEKAQTEGRHSGRARWLEMLGDPTAAAEAWVQADRKDKALPLYEQAGNWSRAAELAEQIQQYDKAAELFLKAGDKANSDRVNALPRPATPPPAPPAEKGEEEPDEGAPAGS